MKELAYQLFDERDKGLQILLERQMELITVLEIDGNYASSVP
jgi:hypothetical protein